MKKLMIALLLLCAVTGSGTGKRHYKPVGTDPLQKQVDQLCSAANRLGRSADSLGNALNKTP